MSHTRRQGYLFPLAYLITVVGCGRDPSPTAPASGEIPAFARGGIAPRFDFVTLGTLGGNWSEATGINEARVVVGAAALTGETATHAVRWTQASGIQDLGTLAGGTNSYAAGISDPGTAVGFSETAQGPHAVFWDSGGTIHDLGPSVWGGVAINNLGDIAWGEPQSDGTNTRILLRGQGGIVQDLGLLGGQTYELSLGYPTVEAISDNGMIVVSPNWVWTSKKGWRHLPLPAGVEPGFLTGVNGRGEIISESFYYKTPPPGQLFPRGVWWRNGNHPFDLGAQILPFGINDDQEMAAASGLGFPEPAHALVRVRSGAVYRLPGVPLSSNSLAMSINADGDVVGWVQVGVATVASAWLRSPTGDIAEPQPSTAKGGLAAGASRLQLPAAMCELRKGRLPRALCPPT